MTEALITIKGETPKIVTIAPVEPFFDPASGERDYEVTRQQARDILTAWQATLPEDAGGFVAMPDHFTVVTGEGESEEWASHNGETGAGATFALGQAPIELTFCDTDKGPVRRITDEAALDKLTRLFNREGDSAADFVEFIGEVLTATGRIVRP